MLTLIVPGIIQQLTDKGSISMISIPIVSFLYPVEYLHTVCIINHPGILTVYLLVY